MIKLFSFLFLIMSSFSVQAFKLEQWSNYESHRQHFIEATSGLNNYNIERFNWRTRSDSNLSTEVALIKNKILKPKKILVMSSGIHGVEAHVGSSVQIAFIKNYLQQPQEKFDFAFIHILNPWGMTNHRRVNFNNVDLNRNFLANASDFNIKNEPYEEIVSFLNPKSKLQLHFAHQFMFILDSIYYIFRYSMESLRQAILQGQYQFPQGIYYGGSQNDELKSHVDQFVETQLSRYAEIYWIDLHTGYGQRGHLHLLSNDANDQNAKRLQDFFPGRRIDFGQNQKFYKTTGDLISYLADKVKTAPFTGVAFEYGTMDSQKSLGSIESLRRMVIENQSYQLSQHDENRQIVEKLLLEMYNPSEQDWWSSIEKQSEELFQQILK